MNSNFECVIDSFAWLAYLNKENNWDIVEQYIEQGKSATSVITIAELSNKFEKHGKGSEFSKTLLFIKSKTMIIDLSVEIARDSGKIKAEARKKIKTFSMADAIIYQTAISLNTKVLTGDQHFRSLSNVIFIGKEGILSLK